MKRRILTVLFLVGIFGLVSILATVVNPESQLAFTLLSRSQRQVTSTPVKVPSAIEESVSVRVTQPRTQTVTTPTTQKTTRSSQVSLNTELLDLQQEYSDAPFYRKARVKRQLISEAQKRKTEMLQLAEDDPYTFLQNTLTRKERNALTESVRPYVEEEVDL